MAKARVLTHEVGMEPSADQLASTALHEETGTIVTSDSEMQVLVLLNRLHILIVPEKADRVVKKAAITRSTLRRRRRPEAIRKEAVQQILFRRI